MFELSFSQPIFLSSGEFSGEHYAALLVKALKKEYGQLQIYGVGGKELAATGVELVADHSELMTFGLSQAILKGAANYSVFRRVARALYKLRPKTFIAVAYPGINLLLCRYARKLGAVVYYLLPPQIWAWGQFRKYFIKKWVDKVISVFPFESHFYQQKKINVISWHNPLFSELKGYERTDFKKRLGFMPGSRISEIKHNIEVVIETINWMYHRDSAVECCIILPDVVCQEVKSIMSAINKISDMPIKFITDDRYQAMKNCDFLIISSGTASFEAAIMGVPQAFFNRPSFFDFTITRRFIQVKEYNLANLYFAKELVPTMVARNRGAIVKFLYARLASCF